MNNREIVFSARETNVLSLIGQIRQASDQLHRSILNSGREEKRISQETLKDYERQITLLDKRKQGLLTTGQQRQGEPLATTAFNVDRQKDGFLPRKPQQDDCCKTQTELLREILSAIKETSQAQLTALSEMQAIERTTSTGTELAGRRHGIHPGRKGGGDVGISDVAGALAGRGGGVGGLMQALKGGAGAAWPLAIVATVAGGAIAAYNNEMRREEAMAGYSGLTGIGVREINSWLEGGRFGRSGIGHRGPSSYGFKEQDFAGRIVPLARAAGTTDNMSERILNSMALERGTSIDQGTIIQMERLARIISDKKGSTDIVQSIFTSMAGSGAWGKQDTDLSRLNELAQTFTQFTESQFMRSGHIGTGARFLNLRSQLERTGEDKFKRDDYAAATLGGINQGLASGGSPEVDAIKMDILRRANPNMGYFELQAEKEKGVDSKGYLEGVMNLVKNTGGDVNQKAVLLDQLLGGAVNKGDILSILKGDLDLSNLDKQAAGPQLDIENRADQATADLRNALDSLKGEISTWGQQLLTAVRVGPAALGPGGAVVQMSDAVIRALK